MNCMKLFYRVFLLAILLSKNCFSQDSTIHVFYLDKLPPKGVLLDKGWKFHNGDDPDYAKPNFDDRSWQSINPTLDIHNLPEIAKSDICWLRLHLSIDT